MNEIPTAIWDGVFTLMGVPLRCSVLDNGQRVINAEDLQRFIEALESEHAIVSDPTEVERFTQWRAGAS